MSCKQDPDNPAFCTGGTTCNSCFPSLLKEEDSSDGSGENNSSETLFHSYLEPEAPQDSNTSLPQPVRADSNTFQYCLPQIGDIPNMPDIPYPGYYTEFSNGTPLWPKAEITEELPRQFKAEMVYIVEPQELQIPENKRNEIRNGDSSSHQQTSSENPSEENTHSSSSIQQSAENEESEIRQLQSDPNMTVLHPSATASQVVMPNQLVAHGHLHSLTRQPIIIDMDESQGVQSDTNLMMNLCPRTRWRINRWILNQNLFLSTRLITKTETSETERIPSFPIATTHNNTIKRQNPLLYFQQQPRAESFTISSSLPIAIFTRPLPASYFSVGCKELNKSGRLLASIKSQEDIDFSKHLYRYQRVNIVLFGPAIWSSKLLQTFSEERKETACRFDWPCSLSCERNIMRGPISMSVFFWQTEDIVKSLRILRGLYNTSKTTILIVENIGECLMSLEEVVYQIRHEINEDIPIMLVECRSDELNKSYTSEIRSAFIEDGCRLKARHNLSGYLECTYESAEEVENVFFKAMDVSQLRYLKM